MGAAIIGSLRLVGAAALIDSAIEVIEGAEDEKQIGIESVDPCGGGVLKSATKPLLERCPGPDRLDQLAQLKSFNLPG